MNRSDIQTRLYRAVLLVGAGLSVACIAGNYFSGFPFLSDVKWIALLAITLFAFFFSNGEKRVKAVRFCVFAFLIFVFLPFAFVDSGGSSNNAIGYSFLLLIVISYLFGGWARIGLALSLIAVFAALHALEYVRPDLILTYSAQAQFIDRMIQIPLLMGASFVVLLGFAKEYERVNRRLNVLAKYDELTGLYNRRMFDQAVEKAFDSAGGPVQLAFLDLNNFKKVNDRCGHSVGDQALRELAALLREAFEPGPHAVSRWGGDEFAVIYYGEKSELLKKMERLREAFDAYVGALEKTAGMSISIVSFGEYATIAEMFLDADRQLYEQKGEPRSGGHPPAAG